MLAKRERATTRRAASTRMSSPDQFRARTPTENSMRTPGSVWDPWSTTSIGLRRWHLGQFSLHLIPLQELTTRPEFGSARRPFTGYVFDAMPCMDLRAVLPIDVVGVCPSGRSTCVAPRTQHRLYSGCVIRRTCNRIRSVDCHGVGTRQDQEGTRFPHPAPETRRSSWQECCHLVREFPREVCAAPKR